MYKNHRNHVEKSQKSRRKITDIMYKNHRNHV